MTTCFHLDHRSNRGRACWVLVRHCLRQCTNMLTSETLVPKDVQQDQHVEPGIVLDSKDENKEFWEQHRCENCGRQYRRAQELRRHTRDKHEQQPHCPFCYSTWSRPEKIRAHLITEHGDRFTEEQNQELHGLRGRRKTIHFIAKCATPTPPP